MGCYFAEKFEEHDLIKSVAYTLRRHILPRVTGLRRPHRRLCTVVDSELARTQLRDRKVKGVEFRIGLRVVAYFTAAFKK